MNLNIRKTIWLFSLLAVLIPSQCLSFLEEDEEIIKSPMPGVIRHIAVVPGQQVKRGDFLCIVEAMKMFVSISAPWPGFIGSLYFTVGQPIEKDMPLVTILPFMPVGKEMDPTDMDQSPLPILQSREPSLKDILQNDLREITEPITSPFNGGDVSDVSSPEVAMATSAEQSIPEAEVEPPISQQEEMSLWIAADSSHHDIPFNVDGIETPNKEVEEGAVASLPSVIAIQEKQSTSEAENEPQTSQQEVTLPWIAAVSSHHGPAFDVDGSETFNDDEGGISAALQKAKAEELRQGNNNAPISTHLLWLTGLLLLGFLSFLRSKPIVPYRVKNVLTLKVAENLNTPEYLRDVA